MMNKEKEIESLIELSRLLNKYNNYRNPKLVWKSVRKEET